MPKGIAWVIMLGIVGGVIASASNLLGDPFPLQHKHPPHDVLGNGQREGRGIYGQPGDQLAQVGNWPPPVSVAASTAAECMARHGVALWNYIDGETYSLTCSPGNVYGDTH